MGGMIMAIRKRPADGTRRTQKIGLYLSDAELVDIVTAAGRSGLTPGSFAAEATVATARNEDPHFTILHDMLGALLKATVPVVEMATTLERIVLRSRGQQDLSEGFGRRRRVPRDSAPSRRCCHGRRKSILMRRSHNLGKTRRHQKSEPDDDRPEAAGIRSRRDAAISRGSGHRDPHHDPHLVAAFRPPAWLEPPLREDGTRDLGELIELLIQPIDALHYPGRSPLVWRCSLRSAPADRRLSDPEWADVAAVVLMCTGLERGGVRWIAVRHKFDHIHLVATLAGTDGLRHNLVRDRWAVRKACRIVEERYDLRRTAPIDRTPASSPSRAEMERTGALPPRYVLHDAIHAAAVVAADEDDFFGRLDAVGIAIHRRRDGSGEVCGYAVALPGHVSQAGNPYFFAGGTLAPDLTLPKLRHRWNHRIRTSQADPWRRPPARSPLPPKNFDPRHPPTSPGPRPTCFARWPTASPTSDCFAVPSTFTTRPPANPAAGYRRRPRPETGCAGWPAIWDGRPRGRTRHGGTPGRSSRHSRICWTPQRS